jgi:hypothetical protein
MCWLTAGEHHIPSSAAGAPFCRPSHGSIVAPTACIEHKRCNSTHTAGSCGEHARLHAQEVLAKDGVIGLFGRGLKTKILANGLQGMLFTVSTLIRYLANRHRTLRLLAVLLHVIVRHTAHPLEVMSICTSCARPHSAGAMAAGPGCVEQAGGSKLRAWACLGFRAFSHTMAQLR